MKRLVMMTVLCVGAASLLAGEWTKPAWISREKGLYRSQIHRGGGKASRPDNSLETFLWCWGLGFAPEADARLTKDGVAIAMHDPTLKRIGRGIPEKLAKTPIKDLNWDEIRDVDTGSYLGAEYATTRLATMEAVFAAMKGRPERLLYVDEKGAPPELIAELANKFGVIEQIYYTSAKWQLIPRWRKVAPKGRSMVWLGNFPKNNEPASIAKTEAFVQQRLDEMAAVGFDGIDQVQIPVDVVVDLVDDSAVGSEDMVRIADIHAVGEGVLDGVEAPSVFVARRDDGLSGWEGAALIVGGRRELPGGLSHLEVLDKEIGVASRVGSVPTEPEHDRDMFLGTGIPLDLGGCHAVIEAGVLAHDTFPVGREVGFQV